jgi:hypothetical protein
MMFNLFRLFVSLRFRSSSHHNVNSSSSGLSKGQGKLVSTGLTYRGLSQNAAMAAKSFRSEAFTVCLSDSGRKDSLTPMKEQLLEAVLSGSITGLRTKENHSLVQSTLLSLDSKVGLQKASEHLLDVTLQESVLIRFCVFPFISFLGPDERVWFELILRDRYDLYRRGYGKAYLFFWDVCVTADFVRRYIGAAVSQFRS